MPAYILKLAASSAAGPRYDGENAMLVHAANPSDAREVAKLHRAYDNDAVWGAATVTEVIADDGEALALTVTIDGTDFSTTGSAGDTVDNVGTALAAVIAATYAGTAYDAGTQIINIPSSANLGTSEITGKATKHGKEFTGMTVTADAASGTAATARNITIPAEGDVPTILTGATI